MCGAVGRPLHISPSSKTRFFCAESFSVIWLVCLRYFAALLSSNSNLQPNSRPQGVPQMYGGEIGISQKYFLCTLGSAVSLVHYYIRSPLLATAAASVAHVKSSLSPERKKCEKKIASSISNRTLFLFRSRGLPQKLVPASRLWPVRTSLRNSPLDLDGGREIANALKTGIEETLSLSRLRRIPDFLKICMCDSKKRGGGR